MKKTISLLSLVVTAVLIFGSCTYGEETVVAVSDGSNNSYESITSTDGNGEGIGGQKDQSGKPGGEGGAGKKECKNGCCGIKLNTKFPIVGNCIGVGSENGTNPINAFPRMMSALTKIAMSLILVACFIIIIVAGIMRAGAGDDNSKVTKAKGLITKVAITILLLGFSGAILRLINPNFFS